MPILKTALLLLALALPASAQVVPRWVQVSNGPDQFLPSAVVVDGTGNVIVTGHSFDAGGQRDCCTAKYAPATGDLLWKRIYNGPDNSDDFSKVVAMDADGNAVIGGGTGPDPGATGFYIAKYAAADGALLWDKRRESSGNGYNRLQNVAFDASGDVLVTGGVFTGSNENRYTAKHAGSDGALIWEALYDGPGHGSDIGNDLAVDAGGNVIVTGYSLSSSFSFDYSTIKYAAADGAVLWETRYNGPANRFDMPYRIKVDAGGDVIVLGYSDSNFSNKDYYTAKYASANGALIWEHRYEGSGIDDYPAGLAVDGSGNVFVTGSSRHVYYTAKYAGWNGGLIWEKSYGGFSDYAQPSAIAVDHNGHVIVTGGFDGSTVETSHHFYTVQYDGSGGTPLWEHRYFNWGGNIQTAALALTPDDGAVVAGYTSGGGGYFTPCIVYYAPPATAHPAWRKQFFGTPDNTGDAADDADPDSDGLPNLMEWACGLLPTAAGPPPGTPARSGAAFTFQYPRSTAAFTAGTVFSVEWSDTLAEGDWHTTGVTQTVLPGDGPVEQVQAALPTGVAKRYARLRLTAP